MRVWNNFKNKVLYKSSYKTTNTVQYTKYNLSTMRYSQTTIDYKIGKGIS